MVHEFIINHEVSIRLGSFFGIFILVATWELIVPRRKLDVSKVLRWYSNLGIIGINIFLLRGCFPIMAVGMAALAQEKQWGILNHSGIPFWLTVVFTIVLLDFIVYLQHVMFHRVHILWRLHRMHHTDLNIDVTTGSRFHPIEIILSMAIKITAVTALGAPPVAVIIFEVLLSVMSVFNHGNIVIPSHIDRVLRSFVVTPDMHRIHHSIIPQETNSNYGFNVSWWDRLLGTYRHNPHKGHEGMDIGINLFRDTKYLNLHWLLLQPFLDGSKHQ